MAYSDSLNNSLQAQGTTCVILFLKHSPLTRDILVWSTGRILASRLHRRICGSWEPTEDIGQIYLTDYPYPKPQHADTADKSF
jgi:hypothetical protein